MTPLAMLGAGHMGGALIAGWRAHGVISASDLIIFDPTPGESARAAAAAGARINPDKTELSEARTIVLALKPQAWRGATEGLVGHLSRDAVVISIMAGVSTGELASVLGERSLARVMPNIAAAIGKGIAAVYARDEPSRDVATSLFEPVATVIELTDERLMHAVTAVGGSGPAYLYAFTEALGAAAQSAGLGEEAASRLARATVIGAAALMEASPQTPAELRRQVTSPGGTTEAALSAIMAADGLGPLLDKAVTLAGARSRALGG